MYACPLIGPPGPQGPQGPPGSSVAGIADMLTTDEYAPQPSYAGGALSFYTNSLLVGDAITHATPGSDEVIQTPGLYLVTFHGTVGLSSAVTAAPAESVTYLTQNGEMVPGALVQTRLEQSGTYQSVSFAVPIQVTSVPTTLQVVSQDAGILYSNVSMSVVRLGNNPTA